MKASCDAYDAGEKWEAIRLATVVYTMVHDHGRIRSILSQLGIKHKIVYLASGLDKRAALGKGADRYTPLIEYEGYRDRKKYPDRIPEFLPLSTFLRVRGQQPLFRELPFEDWWETDVIFFDHAQTLTRQKLVFALRNQEGGGHFDPEMRNTNYLALSKPVWMFTPNYGFGLMDALELATMRQVAEELNVSIHAYQMIVRMKLQHGEAA